MININLSPTSSDSSLSNVGGFNLSLLNIKMLVISLILLYVPGPIMESIYDDKIEQVESETLELRTSFRQYSRKMRELNSIQKQIDLLKSMEARFNAKISVVKKIVNKRQNPFKVLKYVAENMPKNLWIKSLTIKNGELVIIGYSMNWQTIGEFIESLKQSIFFDRNILYSEPAGLTKEYKGKNVHTYEIKTKVVNFE